ncbi:MAG: DUF2721 domain-containing protein [Candidatus Cloacimonadota bacterium]|nr:MAG: DUF2721 domain-containing protein [Candidatus Cloacimonadota bacterium]
MTNDLIQLLKSVISPIVLISGVGLVVLTLSNRLARIVDRVRYLVDHYGEYKEKKQLIRKQLRILYKRSKILRISIFSISISILMSSILILFLFLSYFLKINLKFFFIALFLSSICGLIFSVILLIVDVSLSLKALKLHLNFFEEH